MVHTLAELESASRHVAEGARRVADQRRRIAELVRPGQLIIGKNPQCKTIIQELAATYEHLARLTTEFKSAAGTPASFEVPSKISNEDTAARQDSQVS
jgi:hypothetical protein